MTFKKCKRHMDLGAYQNPSDSVGPSPAELLSWRSDPETNLSDWTIVVSCAEDACDEVIEVEIHDDEETNGELSADSDNTFTTTYHVHKAVLGLGPRGSEYFLNLFKTNGLAESKSNTTRLTLQPSAAVAFPTMLDFMYAQRSSSLKDTSLKATTETAVALRHLANYFGIPSLYQTVNEFIKRDMDRYNIHIYLGEAQVYQDEKIVNATMVVAAESWFELFVSKDGKSRESPAYLHMLPEPQKSEMFHLCLVEAGALARPTPSNTESRGFGGSGATCRQRAANSSFGVVKVPNGAWRDYY